MPEKKFNWGTLILGVIIGAAVVGIIWAASKPATTAGDFQDVVSCTLGLSGNSLAIAPPGQPSFAIIVSKADVSDDACNRLNSL